MAQLGELTQARRLLQRAVRTFGREEVVERARCITALYEIDLASRDLAKLGPELEQAALVLEKHGDLPNAAFAQLVNVRRLLLLGQVAQAERALHGLSLVSAPAYVRALADLSKADIALRTMRTEAARQALTGARDAALAAGIPQLFAEISNLTVQLERPSARLVHQGREQTLGLADIEALRASQKLVVDGCKHEVHSPGKSVSLVTRPVLFALARTLATGGEKGVSREALILEAFGARKPNASHRARLRVEIGRLRRALSSLAFVEATVFGYGLRPKQGTEVVLLLPATPSDESALLALLSAGDAWSTSSLSLALGQSQRSVQRSLGVLARDGKVRAVGRGRTRRWVAPPSSAFATSLLLVAKNTVG